MGAACAAMFVSIKAGICTGLFLAGGGLLIDAARK